MLQESPPTRARLRSVRDVFARRDTFDVKTHALLPIVNLARWSALSVGSAALATTERLQAAAGSAMRPADLLSRERLSPIDRSMLAQAVREIAAAQRRMDNVSAYLPASEWASRGTS